MRFSISHRSIMLVGLALAPLWAFIGIDFFIYFLIAGFSLLGSSSNWLFWTKEELSLVMISMLLCMTAVTGVVFFDSSASRLVSSFYNIAIWFMGVAIIRTLRFNLKKDNNYLDSMYAVAFWLFWIIAVLTISVEAISLLLKNNIQINSLLGIFYGGDLPGLMSSSKKILLTRTDWVFGHQVWRGTVFSPYPNATAITVVILGGLAWVKAVNKDNYCFGKWFVKSMIVLAMIFAVLATGSRGVLLGMVIGILVVEYLRRNYIFKIFYLFLGMALIIPMFGVFQQTVEMREGSSTTRLHNYKSAIEYVTDRNYITGIGFKPKASDSSIPLGSHSTLVSMYTKGGVIGLGFVIIVFFILPICSIYVAKKIAFCQKRNGYIDSIVNVNLFLYVCISIWLLIEDIDAPIFAAFLIFIIYGIIYQLPRIVKREIDYFVLPNLKNM